MSDELDEFTSQLNAGNEEAKTAILNHSNPNPNAPQPN